MFENIAFGENMKIFVQNCFLQEKREQLVKSIEKSSQEGFFSGQAHDRVFVAADPLRQHKVIQWLHGQQDRIIADPIDAMRLSAGQPAQFCAVHERPSTAAKKEVRYCSFLRPEEHAALMDLCLR